MNATLSTEPVLRWRPTLPAPALVVVAVAGGLLVAAVLRVSSSDLPVVMMVCLPAQVAMFVFLHRSVMGRWLAVCVWVAFAWLVYFTARLTITVFDRGNLNEHVVVRAAGDDAFIWAWLITTAGLAAFVVGVVLSGARKPSLRRVPDISSTTLLTIAGFGLLGRYAMVFGGIQSGFIENVLALHLLAFGALGFHAVADRALRRPLYALVAIASLIGVLTSFKEAAIVPIAAVAVGMAAAGVKVGARRLALIALGALVLFLTIQGNRVAFDAGVDRPFLLGAVTAVTEFDLESGSFASPDRTLPEAGVDTVQALSRRFGGVTSIMVIRERVPAERPFLGGASIWQPTASAVPLLAPQLALDFEALSLGRYFTTNFIAVDQPDNASSQAITMLGDLYLNFGDLGVVLGMLVWGIAVGRIDTFVGPASPTRIGALVYVGHILVGVERNVAYLAVNGAIRVTVVLLLLRAMARWGRRVTVDSPVSVPPVIDSASSNSYGLVQP